MRSQRSIIAAVVVSAAVSFAVAGQLAAAESPVVRKAQQPQERQVTLQGKSIKWWAKHAVQARKDANARAATIKRLRNTVAHNPSVQESIKLATMVYPAFTEHRAWCIIKHESWMTRDPLHAKNPRSTATGLYQFLTSTFRSTPYGNMDIYSPYAQSLAAGWMHQHNRGNEWNIRC